MLDDLPHNEFAAILADPPWKFIVRSPKGEGRSPSRHYPVMTMPDIMALPVAGVAARSCHLFLWTSAPYLPLSLKVMEAWGWKYSSIAFTWLKTNPREAGSLMLDARSFHVGLGLTTRKNTEIVLLGRRGNPKRLSGAVRELIIAPRREHSRKPDETFDRVEQYCPGPYLEMFSRENRAGWIAAGSETGKFNGADGGGGQPGGTHSGGTRWAA